MLNKYIQVFSDFILPSQPTSIEEAFSVYGKISQSLGNQKNRYKYASPLSVELTPIKFVSKGES